MFIFKHKRVVIISSVIIAFCLVLAGSYAWFHKEQIILNEFESVGLNAVINEVFEAPLNMRSGEKIEKIVTVQNTGKTNAIVRVSLDEFLALFEIELETGNTKLVDGTSLTKMTEETSTWVAGNATKAVYTKTDGTGEDYPAPNNYLKISSVFSSTKFGIAGRTASIADYLVLEFGDADITGTHDWIYQSGYFYYTKVLKPKESTTPLIKSVTAKSTLPNSYKEFRYQINVNMDALSPYKDALSEWSLASGVAYDALLPILN